MNLISWAVEDKYEYEMVELSASQVSLFYFWIIQKLFGIAFNDQVAAFQDVTALGKLQRHARILLHQQDGGALFVDLG